MSYLTHPPNYINPPSEGWKVTDTDLVTVSFAFVTVVARCYTKFFLVKTPGWDDLLIVLALVAAIGRLTADMVGTHQFGSGRHTWDIPPNYYNGYLITTAVDGYLYVIAISLAKLSLLLYLYRIFWVDKKFRIAAWILGTVVALWATITVFLAMFSCRPITASWNMKQRLDPKTVCNPKSYYVENAYGFCNVISDLVLVFLPIPCIYKMQMSLKKKLGVALVFATGLFICAVAIVRQYIAYTTGQTTDPSWEINKIKVWSKVTLHMDSNQADQKVALEVNIAIIVACLPALSPLFKRLPQLSSLVPSSIRERFSHASAMERAPWPQKLSGPTGDLEQGGEVTKGHAPHASWRKPQAWQDAESKEFEE